MMLSVSSAVYTIIGISRSVRSCWAYSLLHILPVIIVQSDLNTGRMVKISDSTRFLLHVWMEITVTRARFEFAEGTSEHQ